MPTGVRSAVVLGVLLAVAASLATAQRDNTREGFWIGLGAGGGSLKADCDVCSIDAATGPSGYLRLGGEVNSNLLIAGETTSWFGTLKDDGTGEEIDGGEGFLGASVYYYPSATGALWLRGGVGIIWGWGSGTADHYNWRALGLALGAGYDIRIARYTSLVPAVAVVVSGNATLDGTSSGAVSSDFRTTLLALQLGITFH